MTLHITTIQNNFSTHLTLNQLRAFAYLVKKHEYSPDEECDKIMGDYLDSVQVPKDFIFNLIAGGCGGSDT